MNAVAFLALALLVSLAPPARAQAAKHDLVLVSRASGPAGVAGDDSAGGASISADGRVVAFASAADNLSSEDDDEFLDVFVRDLQTNTTTLVSRASGAAGAAGNDFADEPSISADGRFVAFFSAARNFSDEDEDGAEDIFVRDLLSNTTTLASRAATATGVAGDRFSASPSISSDGRLVAFASAADNLSDEDDDFVDVFVRDLHAHNTVLVSVGSDGNSNDPSISADGRFVAFRSDADNLSDEDRDGTDDVFVRDLREEITTLVSVAGDGDSRTPSISADGRLVAFESDATNLSDEDDDGNPDIFIRDLASGTTALVTGPAIDGGALEASISADGRFVAFEAEVNHPGGEPNPGQNIFVHDLQTNTTTFVSRAGGASGAGGDGDSFNPSISGDGRIVAFDSEADNLSTEDDDSFGDVFARDVLGPPSGTPSAAPIPASRPRAPVLGRLRISPQVLRAAGRRRGAVVSFTLDRAAGVRFAVKRVGRGRRGGFTRRGRAGINRFRLTGRLHGRRLRPARYRLIATPRADGLDGDTRRARFRVTR